MGTKRIKDAEDGWDFSEMIEEYGREYLSEVDPDSEIFDLDEDYLWEGKGVWWIICRVVYGGQWFAGDFQYKEKFNPDDGYFVINGYGNWFSISEYNFKSYLEQHIEEDEFKQWCIEQGYFDESEYDKDEEDY